MPYNATVFEFIEAPGFTRILGPYLDDDEYARLQNYLNQHPEAGVIVPGSGGVRKLRWSAEGRGKRSGLRVIYYLILSRGRIWMLPIYGNRVLENIPCHLLKRMNEATEPAE